MRFASWIFLLPLLAACQPGESPESANDAGTAPAPAESVPGARTEQTPVLRFRREDLATAGLGIEGLRGAPPEPADPASPTAEELWRLAVYTNYRALVDVSAAGGFGRLYGPSAGDPPVPGTEYWTLRRLPDGATHVVILQVPEGFPGGRPCLAAAPASGSRGPLGAIGTTGDWALRRGCAVVYTDKGAGPWMSNLGDGRAFAITGVRGEPEALSTVEPAGAGGNGRAPRDETEGIATILEPFSTRSWPAVPDIAVKHAHSGRNPEAHWGAMVLDSIRFALEQLDAAHPGERAYEGDGILVIAAGVSNGGGAVLAASEADVGHLIDGVVAGEPNLYVRNDAHAAVRESGEAVASPGRPLFDYGTHAAVFGPCAVLAKPFDGAPMAGNLAMLEGLLAARCAGLAERGLVEGDNTAARAESAHQAMLEHGMHPAAADAQPANTLINIWALVGGIYANAYGRFEPTDRLCGIGLRAFDAANQPVEVDPAQAARLFGTSPGVPPVAGIDIAAVSADGATKLIFAPSRATGSPAYGLDQVRCLRELWTGDDGPARRVRAGVAETALSGNLGGKPAIIVHGRSDGLVWVNHSSRPYVAANRAAEGDGSNLSYIEVTNAQHFDTLLGFPEYAARFVPLHLYFERALDRMHAHLSGKAALPPSQVIHTRPRGAEKGATPPLDETHVPPMADQEQAEVILWQDATLSIPR